MDRSELGTVLFTAERFDPITLSSQCSSDPTGVSEACSTNIEDLDFDRGHRMLRIIGMGNKPAVIPLVFVLRARSTSSWRAERRADPPPA